MFQKGLGVSCCCNGDFMHIKDSDHIRCKEDFQNQSSITCAQVMLFLCSPFTVLCNSTDFLHKNAFVYLSHLHQFSNSPNFNFLFFFLICLCVQNCLLPRHNITFLVGIPKYLLSFCKSNISYLSYWIFTGKNTNLAAFSCPGFSCFYHFSGIL